MAEVEIVQKAPHQYVTDVTINTDTLAVIETEFEHNYVTGEELFIRDIIGISGVNGNNQPITVVDGTSFISDLSSPSGTYSGGGLVSRNSYASTKNFTSEIRPIGYSGDIYIPVGNVFYGTATVGTSTLTDSLVVDMMVSTDSGASWDALDTASSPVNAGDDNFNTLLNGTNLIVSISSSTFISPRSWETLKIGSFDLAASTWGAFGSAGPLMNPPFNLHWIRKLDNADLVMAYFSGGELRIGASTTDFHRPAIGVWDLSAGTWINTGTFVAKTTATVTGFTDGSPGTATTQGNHGYTSGDIIWHAGLGITGVDGTSYAITSLGANTYSLNSSTTTGTLTSTGWATFDDDLFTCGIVQGANDRFHLFYSNVVIGANPVRANLYERTISIDTTGSITLHDEQLISSECTGERGPTGAGIRYTSGTNTAVVIPWFDGTATATTGFYQPNSLLALRAISTDTPTWSTETISTDHPPTRIPIYPFCQLVENTNGRIYAFWEYPDPDDPNEKFEIWYDSRTIAASSWGTDKQWKTDSTAWISKMAVFSTGTTIGIVYTKMDERDLGDGFAASNAIDHFPHYDVLEVCPAGAAGTGGNYAYLS